MTDRRAAADERVALTIADIARIFDVPTELLALRQPSPPSRAAAPRVRPPMRQTDVHIDRRHATHRPW